LAPRVGSLAKVRCAVSGCGDSRRGGTDLNDSDQQLAGLLAHIATGDEAALTGLYRKMEQPVYRFALSRLRDPHAAAEVLTETMLGIWHNAGRFEGRSKASTWIFGIARYKVLDVLKVRQKHAHEDMDPDMPDEAAPAACEWIATLEDAGALRHCLDALPDAQREVVHFAFFQDMHYDDIAAITECPTGTVKSRMFHARRTLRRCLEAFHLNIRHTD